MAAARKVQREKRESSQPRAYTFANSWSQGHLASCVHLNLHSMGPSPYHFKIWGNHTARDRVRLFWELLKERKFSGRLLRADPTAAVSSGLDLWSQDAYFWWNTPCLLSLLSVFQLILLNKPSTRDSFILFFSKIGYFQDSGYPEAVGTYQLRLLACLALR